MQNDELGVLRRRYVRYLRLERGYSDNTVEAYTHDIDYLLNYLRNENLKVEDVKLEHLQNFAAVIYEFGIASSSQARILCGVRSFFKYLVIDRILKDDPSELLEAPSVGEHLPEVLSTEEVDRMEAAIDLSKWEGQRNRAIIEVLFSCGLRVSELVNLKFNDVFEREKFLRIIGKGDKERLVPISDAALHEIKLWLYDRNLMNDKPGVVLGQKYTPIEKAGVYVPGGTAAYPSTVLMDVIPAKVAGVAEIVMTTPAGKDGRVNPVILAAAATAGVTKIFKTGGAQAVAALAYGTQTIPAVDKIVGPGNIYVATAKRKVFGKVGIDMIAGPSEILVLADGGCDPAWVAADLLSQAEHDKLASPVLVTDSADLAKAVQAELEVQIPQLPRAAIARASVDDNGKIIVCSDLRKAIEACNIIAPEHLEVCIDDPFSVLNEIKNAGSIFLGRNVPEALGDYFAGPNHTLPTSGTARFSSPLGVDDFVKKSSFLYYTREALEKAAPRIADFAEQEGLHAHARSVTIRYDK